MATSNTHPKTYPQPNHTLDCFSTALVLLPPPSIQSRINALRIANDKSYPRWTSHITLIFPFVRPEHLHTTVASIQRAVSEADLKSFDINLDITNQFPGRGYDTIYLSPSGVGCNETQRLWTVLAETLGYSGRPFIPHLTLGQAFSKEDAQLLHGKGRALVLREPIFWTVNSIVCLRKDEDDEGRMKIFDEITLPSPSPIPRSSIARESPFTFRFDLHECAWLSTPPPITEYDAVKELSIMTYNVLHDHEHPSSRRCDKLVSALADIDADVVCLQEVTDELLALFLDNMTIRSKWKWCNRGPDAAMESERNIVVFSRENLPFSWQRVTLGGKHKAAVLASLHFVHPTANDPRTIVIAAIHLTAGLQPKQLSAKFSELQALSQHLQRWHGEDDWIIAGDTNLPRTHSPLPLIDHLCIDAWKTHHGPDGSVYDATYDPTRNVLAAETVRQDKTPQRYDRIYIKKSGMLAVSSIALSENVLCSDHWPLHARLIMQSSAAETLPLPHVSPNVHSRADGGGHTPHLEDRVTDTELRAFAQSANAIPHASHLQRKERVIQTLCRTLVASRDGSPVTDTVLLTSSLHGAQAINSVRLVLVPVGSFALGVDFPDSDLDCIVVGNVTSSTFWAISRQRIHSQSNDADLSPRVTLKRFVKDAAVQMMVLEADGIKVDLQYCPSVGLAESWPVPSTFLDANFSPMLNVASMRVLNAHRDRIRLENTIPHLPSFQLAFRSVKLYCVYHGIYAARFGYFGGIHIAILLTQIASNMPATASATDLVRQFFNEYATFDWATRSATAAPVNSTYRRGSREPMVILSAERPVVNTAANATAMNVMVISEELRTAKKQLIAGTNWSKVCGNRGSQIHIFLRQFDSFVKIHISHWGGNCTDARALVGFVESRIIRLLVDLHIADPDTFARLWPERFNDANNESGERSTLDGFYLIGLKRPTGAVKPLISATQSFEEFVQKSKYYDGAVAFVSAYECSRDALGTGVSLDTNTWADGGIDELSGSDDEDATDSLADLDVVEPSEYKSNSSLKKKKPHKAETNAHIPAPKLRTSADVFNRLMWDPDYDASDYVIGYEDRFEGVKEMQLKNWARDVEDETFVPFHRVVHFRKKSTNEMVWDRKAKLDKIFGSGHQT